MATYGTIPPLSERGGESKLPPTKVKKRIIHIPAAAVRVVNRAPPKKPSRRQRPPAKPQRRRGSPIGAPTNAQERATAGKSTLNRKPAWNHSRRGAWSLGKDIAAHIESRGGAPDAATAAKMRGNVSPAIIKEKTRKLKLTSRMRKAKREQEDAVLRKDYALLTIWNDYVRAYNADAEDSILDARWERALQATKLAERPGGSTKSGAQSEFSNNDLNAEPIEYKFFKQAKYNNRGELTYPERISMEKGRIGGRKRKTRKKQKRNTRRKKKRRRKRRRTRRNRKRRN